MCISASAIAQSPRQHITYTNSFTKTIDRWGISVFEPVESWLHVYPLDRDAFMCYDLVLQNDRNDVEMRYRIRPYRGKWKKTPSRVEMQRLLSSISSNEPENVIRLRIPDQDFLLREFNATEGYVADFTPKLSYSEKPFGTLISLVAEDGTAVDVIVLQEDPMYDACNEWRYLRFQ